VVAARAYRSVVRSASPQMILVSGESGAGNIAGSISFTRNLFPSSSSSIYTGKTESCRLVLQVSKLLLISSLHA
jgi:hypothetical protein